MHLGLSIESIHRPKRCTSNGWGNHINPLKINVIQKLQGNGRKEMLLIGK